jgi:hypothetical protein
LHPTHGEDALFAPGLIAEGIESGEIDAIEPVGPLSRQRRMGQWAELPVVSGVLYGAGYRLGGKVVDQYPFYRCLGAEIAQDFVDQ